MRIIFERTGGLMGRKISLTIDLNELPPDQAETLRRLLDNADFFKLSENPPIHPALDSFQYIITVETDKATHTIHTSDTTAPEGLHPLLQELSQRARVQRKS
jgi:hypothetical protein